MCVFSFGSTRCENDVINPSKVKPLSDDVSYFRWNHAQLCQYYEQTRVLLEPIYTELGVCDHLTDDYDVGSLHDRIEKLYNSVVEAFNISADLYIPRTRRNFYKFWWSQ